MSSRQTEDPRPSPEDKAAQPKLVVVACDTEEVEPEDATRPLQMPPELAELPVGEEEPTDMFGALSVAPSTESFSVGEVLTDHYGVRPLRPISRPHSVPAAEPEEEEVGIDSEHEDTVVGPPRVAAAAGE